MVRWNGGQGILLFKIAARAGYKPDLDHLQAGYLKVLVTKDEYEETLRAYHESVVEMKSDKREETDQMIWRGVQIINEYTRNERWESRGHAL